MEDWLTILCYLSASLHKAVSERFLQGFMKENMDCVTHVEDALAICILSSKVSEFFLNKIDLNKNCIYANVSVDHLNFRKSTLSVFVFLGEIGGLGYILPFFFNDTNAMVS